MKTKPDISGERHHWRKTRKPEQPYKHQYHLTLVDKIFLCMKSDPKEGTPPGIHCTFAQALERIQKIDNMTRGIPKIMYLVGWQFEGHDSKYPAWSEVNNLLKRPEDKTPLDSLLWLMEEAYDYNTTVSLHINMNDAYENSPLWNIFKEKGTIIRKGGVWGGEQCYLISHVKEWETGLAQKRIDDLLEMLPLEKAGTIHIDAFWMVDEDREGELSAMRKIIRYWRARGMDVTTEGIVQPDLNNGFMGLIPMVWHINNAGWGRENEFKEEAYMEIPASLFCGGVDHTQRALLFGTNMAGEGIPNREINRYLTQFCLNTLPWQYLNHYQRGSLIRNDSINQVQFSDGLISQVVDKKPFIQHKNVILRDGNDVFVPALWKTDKEIIAFSAEGYQKRRWELPSTGYEAGKMKVSKITGEGLKFLHEKQIIDNTIELSLEPNEAVCLIRF